MDYSAEIRKLFDSQLQEWALAGKNYSLLSKVRTRILSFDGFTMLAQFNPERIRSSAASVDAKSIEARPCFLCKNNRPAEQKGVGYTGNLTVLVNPFPIFPRHLTIPSEQHVDQRIAPNFVSMLSFAHDLNEFIIFYNGPECGASAPDHFHFQAGNKGFLPIGEDFRAGRLVRKIDEKEGVELWHWVKYLRGIMTLRGKQADAIAKVYSGFYEKFARIQEGKPEPMLNIIASFSDGWYTVHIIPRKLHRPVQFFEEGGKQILLSPASVDLGGVIILPREEDFLKITENDVEDIFKQVCLTENEVLNLFS